MYKEENDGPIVTKIAHHKNKTIKEREEEEKKRFRI